MHIKRNRLLCQVAIAFFILAGITGVLFRMGMLGADIFGLSLQNIRHAHSHLMFFGWAGFLPLIIASNAQSHAASKKWTVLQQRAIWAIVVLSPITFFFFLLWGYHPVAIGEAQLPLAAILSSFVMIAWYAFAFGYWRSKPEKSKPFQSWFSVALLMLIVSSLGAWGVGALQFFDIENILIPKAMTHFFLGTFTEGWVVLIVMGLIVRALKLQSSDFFLSQSTLQTMIAFGAPITFAFGMPNSMLTNELLWSARIGGMISSAAILIFCFGALKSVWRTNSIWLWPVVLLGTKALIVLITSLFPNELWLSDHNLRILYLHILLLGAFTIAGFGWMHSHFNTTRQSFNLIVYSCLAVLISLVLPTNVVPTPMKGLWVFYVITLVAIFPVISAMYQFVMVKLSS
ncbi:MAG: hypothetical protein JJ895_15470 [Balneolaceae bacterium]|nr:hypothetical protein [Balneolaceae bacterium]